MPLGSSPYWIVSCRPGGPSLAPSIPNLSSPTLDRVTGLSTAQYATNWTSAAGALEGVLEWLGAPLPRHAVMGLTGHAWHFCLGTREDVTALPSGPADLDWQAMLRRYERTGFRWERFASRLHDGGPPGEKEAAIRWAITHLDAGRPLIGFDLHVREYGIITGYDGAEQCFFVSDVLTEDLGPRIPWRDWPSSIGIIELWAPAEPVEVEPLEALGESLETALMCFAGGDGPQDGQPRGTAGLEAWADALAGETEVDRAGHAYTLSVLQAARLDGADYLADIGASIPELEETMSEAERAIRDETQALAPLITLFPFPAVGHGNVDIPGLRRAGAMALRRAARHEREAAAAIEGALELLRD